jgi:hypothetical protein
MRCQPPHSLTKKAGHGTRGVLLAALGTLLTANAVSQNQPNAPTTTSTQKPATTPANQTKRPAATPSAVAKQPPAPASTAPKPSVMDKARSFFGMKKSSSDTGKPDQPHSFLDYFHSHGNNADKSTPSTLGAATNARTAPSHAAERAQETPGGVTRPGAPIGNETRMPNGNVARTARDGSLRELHSSQNNMSIHYGMNGSRQIRVDQPDGSRIVLASRGVPYVQRPWNFGSRAFDHRTYLDNGVLTHQFYRPYLFGGTTLDAYAPQRFYSQDFYKSVAKPQLWTPPAWSFLAKQEPWYGHYQTYFTPQSSYASPVFWLTDFVLAMSLFEAYNAHPLPAQAPPSLPATSTPQSPPQAPNVSAPIIQAPIAPAPTGSAPVAATPAPAAPILQPPVAPASHPPTDDQGSSLWERFANFIRGLLGQAPAESAASSPGPAVAVGATPITDDVKNKVADEVETQIEEEAREAGGDARNQEPKAGAGGVVEELARPAQHVFVVASDLDLIDDSGRRCMMSEGDVIQILSAADAESGTAPGVVLSGKGGVECPQSAKVSIAVSDLQEMQNHMRATIDQGLANTPRGATEPTVTPAFAGAAPPPDADAKSEIEKQKTIAASVERG